MRLEPARMPERIGQRLEGCRREKESIERRWRDQPLCAILEEWRE